MFTQFIISLLFSMFAEPTFQPTLYFDNNATTRIAPEVFEAMVPYLTEHYGNPSSLYRMGVTAAKALKTARVQVADMVGCSPEEIYFTSCGTEADNTALESALAGTRKRHIITTSVEHSALIKQGAALEKRGIAVTYLPVDGDGRLDLADVERAIRRDTALISVMWANNETGVLFPLEEIVRLCKDKGLLFHTDAVQVPGKVPISMSHLAADYLSIAGHKFHAPKGVGALFVRKGAPIHPYLIGGGQESGKRGGTENVASIVGMGRAAELALEYLEEEQTRVRAMRDRFEATLGQLLPDVRINGAGNLRLPNTSSLCVPGIEGEALLLRLDKEGMCASSGSACTTGAVSPSHVLTAMGVPPELARGAVRFSFGRYNTDEEVDRLLAVLPEAVTALRAMSPAARMAGRTE
jgi:cysteine desulfurase